VKRKPGRGVRWPDERTIFYFVFFKHFIYHIGPFTNPYLLSL
jgi:hypothetical protein